MQYKQKHITQTQENGQEKRFLHVLTASIREMRQKTFKLAIFLGPVVKHNRNKLNMEKQQNMMILSREVGQKP